MPRSEGSSFKQKSGSAHSVRYRSRAPASYVDETLFGSPQKLSACDVQVSAKLGCSGPRGLSRTVPARGAQKPETVRIITKDLIRDLKVPSKDPSGLSIILRPSEMERIMAASRIPTKAEKEAVLEAHLKEREATEEAVEERKARIRQADLSRQKKQGLSDLESEARERAMYLLERSNAMRMEQEDEIKKLNEVVLSTQCHAVRDAQILEKRQILSELQEEERRLDAMMEEDRRQALEAQEQINERRKHQRIQGGMLILNQINERLEERLLQDEKKEQEGQQMLENLEKMQTEELEVLERKKEVQRQLQLEILQINEKSLQEKENKKEEERLADLRAMEYTRQKMEREADYEAEQRRIKREKEMDISRLRALQERERNHKAEQDELRARRNHEAAEREWRRKEKEQTMKQVVEEERLKAARLEQVTHKEHMLSIEAGRERAEFERVLRAQEEAIAREREKEALHRQRVARHSEVVRQQIRERETRAIELRREVFRESERLSEEARSRRAHLDKIKEKKLRELKAAGLPEKYCNEVERKVRILPTLVR